jgi:hypothetical protein
MTCDSVSKLIPLYFYGELDPGEEERVEEHLHECAACSGEMDRQRMLGAALDRRQAEVPAFLLEDCRADLLIAIEGGAPRQEKEAAKGPWKLFLEAVGATFGGLGRYRQPIGALALLAVGFFAARLTGGGSPALPVLSGNSGAPSENVFATVRSVQPDASGRVRIVYDETRRREISGDPDDDDIQRLALAAAHEENPAVRMDSMGLLKERANSSEVRDALLNALAHDANAGVRLKALEGLKPLGADPEVRRALAGVLLADENAAVRMQVVDLLVAHRDGSMVGMLQGLVQRENNNSVRLKLEKALKDMNASIGTF